MSCGCSQIRKERSGYDNIKRLAKAWAKADNKVVLIYKNPDGSYGFMGAGCPEALSREAIEYVSPLQ